MKTQDSKNSSKYKLLKILSAIVILTGLSLSAVNLARYAQGYFAASSSPDKVEEFLSVGHKSSIEQPADVIETSQPAASGSKKYSEGGMSYLIRKSKLDAATGRWNALYSTRPDLGEEIGKLYIPKLEAVIPIYHGTDEEELDRGIGHYPGSVLPGENDNSVLSGHRDTVFRKLGEVSEGDTLIVRTAAGEFTYVVNKVRIVDKDDRTVIVPKPKATLTVTTCYPFYYVGSAPDRYVLVAFLADKTLY